MSGFDKGPILVTGASGGIGGATVRQLVAEGAEVIASGRNEEALSGLAARDGGPVRPVGDPEDPRGKHDDREQDPEAAHGDLPPCNLTSLQDGVRPQRALLFTFENISARLGTTPACCQRPFSFQS